MLKNRRNKGNVTKRGEILRRLPILHCKPSSDKSRSLDFYLSAVNIFIAP